MTEYEAYQDHIRYTHDAYCRIVIRHASFDAARMLAARWKREISLEYLTEEKFVPLSATDEYFQVPDHRDERMVMCSSSSSPCTRLLTLGWETYSFWAALLNEPHRSTMDTYFNCCNVICAPAPSRCSASIVQAYAARCKAHYFSPFSATQPRTYSTNRRVDADSAFSSLTAMPMLR